MKKIRLYGNWKMNMTRAETTEFMSEFARSAKPLEAVMGRELEVAVFPPFTSLWAANEAMRSASGPMPLLGAQNVYFEPKGAFTGEVSIPMLEECGCTHVILGHSERRHILGEGEPLIAKKMRACLDAGLIPVLCYGETLEEREAGRAFQVMERQLRSAVEPLSTDESARVVYAYEPVWAIGTGKSATSAEAQEVCAWSKRLLAEAAGRDIGTTVLYGGSVKGSNAKELLSMDAIDGALVGGASLKPESFLEIYTAYAGK